MYLEVKIAILSNSCDIHSYRSLYQKKEKLWGKRIWFKIKLHLSPLLEALHSKIKYLLTYAKNDI